MKLRILAMCVLLLAPLFGCGGGGGSTPVVIPIEDARLEGTWGDGTGTLTLMMDGTYQIDQNNDGVADSWGDYSNTLTQIILQDSGGVNACLNTAGTYSYSISGNTLTLALVSDSCSGRSTIIGGADWSAQATGDTTTPTAPLNLTAQAVSSSQINLAWLASSDNVAVSGYLVYENNALLAITSGLAFSDTGLAENVEFCYTLAAFDAAGNVSNKTAPVCATTTVAVPGDTTAPSVPTNLSATSVTTSQINLAWTASTDAVGVSSYNVYRDNALLTTTVSNSLQDAGLSAATSYCYKVEAQDAAGNVSAQSIQFCTQTSQVNGNASLVRHLRGIGSITGLVDRQI